MNNYKKTICFIGSLLGVCMIVPTAVHADESAIFTFSDRNTVFQQDEEGHIWYQQDEEIQTGLFALEPDYLLGDITQDDVINAEDAAIILKAAAASGAGAGSVQELLLQEFPDYEELTSITAYADIDGDSSIDASDAARILKYAAASGAGEDTHVLGYSCYYADENGYLQKGFIQNPDTGETYYAQENYVLSSGWVNVDDKKYYLDQDSYALLTGWQNIGNKTYWLGENGEFTDGWNQIDGQNYYFTQSGGMQTGWSKINEELYHFEDNGVLSQNIWIDGYYLDENGTPLKGWQELDGIQYYFDTETGSLYSGWLADGENTLWLDKGIPAQGWETIEDQQYYFHAGMMLTGWLTEDENTYYLQSDGTMATDFIYVDDCYYYMGDDGIMQKRKWLFIDDKTYYLGLNGDCLTGWQNLTGYIYYFQPDGGVMSTGWLTLDGKTYYFDPDNGTMQKGWITLDDVTYYLNADGSRATGLTTADGSKYYFDADGLIQTGWITIGDNQYYFYPETGKMAVNTTIDGTYLGSNGLPASTKLALNQQRARDALNQYGTSVSSIYNYVRSTTRYKYIESTRSLSQIEANGWLYYVDYAFTHYYGVCYYLAAKMDFILREAGYQCRIVHATHGSGDHYWNQVYINGSWVNYDCTNGYNAYSWSRIIAAGNYTFLGYVTPTYQ